MGAVLFTVAFALCVCAVAVMSWLGWDEPEDLGDISDWMAWEDQVDQ